MSMYKELSYDKDISSIKGIQFCILSAESILSRSVAEINRSETYNGNDPVPHGIFDPRMGVIEHNKVCVTCEKKNTFCPGHFGHIVLAKPQFYIQFFHITRNLLKCVCYRCSKLLVDADSEEVKQLMAKKGSRQKRYEIISKMSSKIKRCGQCTVDGCGAKQPSITKDGMLKLAMEWKDMSADADVKKQVLNAEDVLRIFRRISDRDSEILGFNKKFNRPEDLICTVLPVPPPSVRPSVRNDTGQRSEDDLTHKLSMIVKVNNQLKTRIEKGGIKEHIDTFSMLLQYEIATMIDNTIPNINPSLQRTGRPIRSLIERLKGKEGRIRGNLMGKRVDFSARSVITPDPNISIDELGVPIKIAMNLTFPEVVNKYNVDELRLFVANGPDIYPGAKHVRKASDGRTILLRNMDRSSVVLEYGDTVDRHLRNGDYVLFNRQPSLHRSSMMAHRVRVMPFNTFRLNVMVTPSFNADFDGDEMNMHVAQSYQTHEELLQLAAVPTQIISPREYQPIVSVVQDIVLGLYRLTKQHVRISDKQMCNIMAANPRCTGELVPAAHAHGQDRKWSGQQLLSTIMPRKITVNMGNSHYDSEKRNEEHYVKIRCGEVLQGVFDKGIYQQRTVGIVHSIYNEYGPEETKVFFDNTQQLICNWLVLDGFSVGISDMMVDATQMDKFKSYISQMKVNVYNVISDVHSGKYENNSTKTNYEDFEKKVNDITNNVIKEVGDVGVKVIDENVNRLINMIKSKSKGNSVNVSQMIGCLGQQNVDGRRIPNGFDDRTLPHYCKYDDGPEAHGFVESSFIKGLTPQEFFFAAMGGREGLIDTAVQTSESGYLQRKLVKAMEDCKVGYDGSVRNASGAIVQFLYGDDGMDACKIESQKIPYIEMKPEQLLTEYLWTDHTTPALAKRLEDHYRRIMADRDFVISKMFKGHAESTVAYPVSLFRTINIARGLNVGGSELTPDHVLDALDALERELYVNVHHRGTQLLHILLRAYLSPKVSIVKHQLSRESFDYICEQVRAKFHQSLASPLEMVGVLAAQSMGEPATQLSVVSTALIIVETKAPDGKRKMYYGPIGKLIDDVLDGNKSDVVDLGGNSSVLDMKEGMTELRIIGVSNQEKTSWRRISQVSRHPANGGMVRIHTLSGKTTCATLSHSFLKRTERGISPVLGSELKEGDRVPVAKWIPQVPDPVKTVFIDKDIALDKDFGWLCGTYIADGCIMGHTVSISKVIPEYQDKLRQIYKDLWGLEMSQSFRDAGGSSTNVLNGWDMSRYSGCENRVNYSALAKFMLESFNTGSFNKRLPGWVYAADIEFVKGLICGYFDGDGNVNDAKGKQMIRSASVSSDLTQDFIVLLARVGIFASKCVETHKKEPNRNDLHTIQISRKYARKFRETVGPMVVKHKDAALQGIIEYVEREDRHATAEQIDKIPELGDLLAAIGKALELPGQSRLYKRYQKKESIGRMTLGSYIQVFEEALEAETEKAEARYKSFKAKLIRMKGVLAAARATPDAINKYGIMDLDAESGEDMLEIRTPTIGFKALGAANLHSAVKAGRMSADCFEKNIFALVKGTKELRARDRARLDDIRNDKLPALRQAFEADVVWDEIVKVERLPDPGEMVYDFTVPGNDSFMVDAGLLVHNTLNSVHHDTELLLRIDGQLTRTTIGDFSEGHISAAPKKRLEHHPNDTTLAWVKDGGEKGPHSKIEVLAPTKDGKIIWDEVCAVTKHPVKNEDGSNTLLHVKTRGGREVIATKGDSFVMRIDNKIQAVKGSDLKVGDLVPVSNILPVGSDLMHLDVSMYLPKTEFTYGTDILKAKSMFEADHAQGKFHSKWWQGNGKEFTLPYSRGDSATVSWRNTDYKEGIVYPKKCCLTTSMIPDKIPLTKPFGFMVGAYLAEGCVSQCNDNAKTMDQFHQLLISNLDPDFQAEVDAFSKAMCVQYHWDDSDDERGRSMTQRIHSVVLATLFKRMLGYLAPNKRFPSHLLAANEDFLKGVVDGYFSGDGSVEKNGGYVTAVSVSRGLLEDVRLILAKFDIRGAITLLKKKDEQFEQAYTLEMYNNNAVKFMKTFTLTLKQKQERMTTGITRERVRMFTYDKHDFIPSIKLSDQTIDKIHRDKIPDLMDTLVNKKDKLILSKVLSEDLFYDRIVSIKEVPNTKSHVYDLTTRQTKNFNTYSSACLRDTFHFSGVSSASKSVRGVPRLKELLSVSKNPKTPSMSIKFKDEFKNDKDKCEELMHNIRVVRFKDVVVKSDIFFDPNDSYNDDNSFIRLYREFLAGDEDARAQVKTAPWLIRLEFDKEAMMRFHLDMIQIHNKLLDFYKEDVIVCKFNDDNADKLIFRIKLVAVDDEDDMFTRIKALEHNILEKIMIKGTEGIENAGMEKKDVYLYDPISAGFIKKHEYVVYTDGSNFKELLTNDNIDAPNLHTNNVNEILEVLGIEAARQAQFNEIMGVMESVTVNYRHVALLVDMQTNRGNILSVDRHGINRGDIGPLAKCSFEESTDKLIKAGIFAEYDKINGVSANIMLGAMVPAGTGDVQLVIDEDMLQETTEQPYTDDLPALDDELCREEAFAFDFVVPEF